MGRMEISDAEGLENPLFPPDTTISATSMRWEPVALSSGAVIPGKMSSAVTWLLWSASPPVEGQQMQLS